MGAPQRALIQSVASFASGMPSCEAGVGAALRSRSSWSLHSSTFEAFADTCEKYTDLVMRDESGSERIQPLSKVSEMHMRGRYVDMVALMRAHVEAQFGAFFGRLGELLGGPPDEAAPK